MSEVQEEPTTTFIHDRLVLAASEMNDGVDLEVDLGDENTANYITRRIFQLFRRDGLVLTDDPNFVSIAQMEDYQKAWLARVNEFLELLEDAYAEGQDEDTPEQDAYNEAILLARDAFCASFKINIDE